MQLAGLLLLFPPLKRNATFHFVVKVVVLQHLSLHEVANIASLSSTTVED